MYKPQDNDNARPAAARPSPQPAAPGGDGLVATGLRQVRRVAVLIVGGAVLLAGLIMILTPGPGLVGIALGLGILSIEFAWARSLLQKFKQKYMDARDSFRNKKTGKSTDEKQNRRS